MFTCISGWFTSNAFLFLLERIEAACLIVFGRIRVLDADEASLNWLDLLICDLCRRLSTKLIGYIVLRLLHLQ